MKISFRKFIDKNVDNSRKYEAVIHDANGICHSNNIMEAEEFSLAVVFYFDNGYNITPVDDNGQSEEHYEVVIDEDKQLREQLDMLHGQKFSLRVYNAMVRRIKDLESALATLIDKAEEMHGWQETIDAKRILGF